MAGKKLIYGVGINDADYDVHPCTMIKGVRYRGEPCPYYVKWHSMLERCYSTKYQERQPSYIGCSVCKEWHTFSNFKRWMQTQNWQGRELDKDWLVDGNKVYSPQTCMFVTNEMNNCIRISKLSMKGYPLGVSKQFKRDGGELAKPWAAYCSVGGKRTFFGLYSTSLMAHIAYLRVKRSVIEELIDKHANEDLLMQGLTRVRNKIEYHVLNEKELKYF